MPGRQPRAVTDRARRAPARRGRRAAAARRTVGRRRLAARVRRLDRLPVRRLVRRQALGLFPALGQLPARRPVRTPVRRPARLLHQVRRRRLARVLLRVQRPVRRRPLGPRLRPRRRHLRRLQPHRSGVARRLGNADGNVDRRHRRISRHLGATVAPTSSCASPTQSFPSVSATSQALAALTDGTYYACLVANAADGGQTTAANSGLAFTVDATAPAAFAITAPAAQNSSATPTVTWNAASDASSVTYDLAIGTTPSCSPASQTASALSGTSHALTSLSDGAYYACVTARDAAGNTTSASNSGDAFTVDTTPPAAFSRPARPRPSRRTPRPSPGQRPPTRPP